MGFLLALKTDPPPLPDPGSSLWTVAQKGDAAGVILQIDDTHLRIAANGDSDQSNIDFAYQEIAAGDIDVQALVPETWVGHIENFTGFGVGITDGLDDAAFYAQCWRPNVGPAQSKWGTGELSIDRETAMGIAGTTLPRYVRVSYDSVAQEISFWERGEGEPWALINTVAQELTYPLYAYVFGTSGTAGQTTTADITQCIVSQGQPDDTPPLAPESCHTITISSTRIDVSWPEASDPESGIQGYRVYRSLDTLPDPFEFQQVSPLVAGLAYSDTGLTPDTDYFYVVTSVNGVGLESEFSAPVRGPQRTDPAEDPEDPPTGTAPLLFQDLSGRDFAGEPGALAANDDWANTVYSYTPRFAPNVGTLESPTGNPAKPGASGVNPNNAAEYLVVDRAGFLDALEDNTFTRVFIAKGTDIRGNDITMNAGSGTQANPRKFYWWDPDTPSNITDIRPWNLNNADRVLMPRLQLDGVAWLWFVGLSVDGNRWAQVINGSNNLLFYRCEAEDFENHAFVATTGGGARPHTITVYECYVHDSQIIIGDAHGFLGNPCDNFRIISCAGRNLKGDFFQLDGNSEGGIVEDCDYWHDKFYDADGTENANGDFSEGEGFIDVKNFGAGVEPLRVYGNRAWDMKHPRDNQGGCTPFRFSQSASRKRNVDIRWNVFTNNMDGGISLNNGSDVNGSGQISVVRNIIDAVQGSEQGDAMLFAAFDASEYYLNTLSNSPNTTPRMVHFFTDPGNVSDVDMMGMLIVDAPDAANAWSSTGSLDINTGKVGYNTFVGQFTYFNQGYGAANDNQLPGANGKTNFAAGDFIYVRKKLTAPENAFIPNIVPTTQSLAALGTLVPTAGADQIGSRAGIGIDDDF